jgi:hypothetical protein
VKNELQAASGAKPLSVLIADIGAVPPPKPEKVQVPESTLQPGGPEEILIENGPCTADSSIESGEVTFGGGDRTGLFLLIERIRECVEGVGGGGGGGGHVSATTDSDSSSSSSSSNNDNSNNTNTNSSNNSNASSAGSQSDNSTSSSTYSNNGSTGTYIRPKISLSDVNPHNSVIDKDKEKQGEEDKHKEKEKETDKETEKEREREESALIIAIAQVRGPK